MADGGLVELGHNHEYAASSDTKPETTKPKSRLIISSSSEKSQIDYSMFDIFGFGAPVVNILSRRAPYGLMSALPQCDCQRIPSNSGISENKKSRALPRSLKRERCGRFNHWWLKCCQSAILRRSGLYHSLVKLLERKIVVDNVEMYVADLVLGQRTTLAISLDICRTYPSLNFYKSYGRRILRRILMAYAFFDPEVGYVQGLNFIVGNLLWHSVEEQAFWAFMSMMYLYDLRCMFLPGLKGVFKRCEVLECCMVMYMPKLYNHLKKVGVHIPMIASDWFMTLCANSVPIKPLGRLWDHFFSHGWVAIYQFIIYRLKQFEEYLLTMSDVADIMKVIKYGNPSLTERSSLIELIPGLRTSIASKGLQLVDDAYSTNFDNFTNDPNRDCNDTNWTNIVQGSLRCNIKASFIEELELKNSEAIFYDCVSSHRLSSSGPENGDGNGLISCNSSISNGESEDVYPLESEEIDQTKSTDVVTLAMRKDGTSPRLEKKLRTDGTEQQTFMSFDLLRRNGFGDIADQLTELSAAFRKQLTAISISNAYPLHLRALHEDL